VGVELRAMALDEAPVRLVVAAARRLEQLVIVDRRPCGHAVQS
jgi:hypothetical protein